MQKITTFLTFYHQAEPAVNFYTSIFDDSEKSNRVLQAMLKMSKIEINGLIQAYEGK